MMDQQKIEEQARQIMDDFMKELGNIEQPREFGLLREAETRQPAHQEASQQFIDIFFENAPRVQDRQLMMEKKQW